MRRPRRNAALAGALGIAGAIAGLAFDPSESVDLLRQRLYDRLLALAAPGLTAPRVVVLDIDAASLASQGPWPWRRERRRARAYLAARRRGRDRAPRAAVRRDRRNAEAGPRAGDAAAGARRIRLCVASGAGAGGRAFRGPAARRHAAARALGPRRRD